jgi:membrane protease YdiL (CAAX protease family)
VEIFSLLKEWLSRRNIQLVKHAQQGKMKTWYQIAIFYLLAFFLGAGTIVLVVVGVIPPNLVLISVLSASIAGISLTAIADGKAGLRLLIDRLLIWRVGFVYWLFALFGVIPVIITGSLLNPIFNGDPIDFGGVQLSMNILPMFLGFVILAGAGQELGWTGFLIPRLQGQVNALTSAFIRAILAAIWHIPVFVFSTLQPESMAVLPYSDWIKQQGILVAVLAAFLLFMIPWSIFYTWIFNNTKGSLLLVAILHGSEIWVVYWMVSMGINPNKLDNYWGYGAVMVLVAVIVVFTSGPANLSRKHKRIDYQPAEFKGNSIADHLL